MYEEGGSDGDVNDMAVCLPTTDAGDFAYQIYCQKSELCGVPIHVIMNQVGNLCNHIRSHGRNLKDPSTRTQPSYVDSGTGGKIR